jgi:hypothetical protein
VNSTERATEISTILKSSTPVKTGIKRIIAGKNETFDGYEIPTNLLVYNPRNGRFASRAYTIEAKLKRKLNPENDDDEKLIDDFIWDSNANRNDDTLEDIKRKGQLEEIMITADGRIIDGNRRVCILRRLVKEASKDHSIDIDKFSKALAIILPEGIDDTELELLETEYQMGSDDKVDYNAIEKYMKVHRLLREKNVPMPRIRQAMNFKSDSIISSMIEVFDLMEDYLEFINSPKQYEKLDGLEDHFLTLHKALKKLNKHADYSTEWDYSDIDIVQLKMTAFDYMRAKCDGRTTFRNLFVAFTHKPFWEDLIKKHEKYESKVNEEIEKEVSNGAIPLEEKNKVETSMWRDLLPALEEHLDDAKRIVKDTNMKKAPSEILERVLNTLDIEIDEEILQENYTNDLETINRLKAIKRKIDHLISIVELGD